jgi:Glycosyltransferase family 87
VLAGLWIAAVIVVSIQATAQHNNNFEIFRTAWLDLLAERDLYAPSERHHDFFKYSPTFALLFAPFAVLPFWLGVLLWNGANAGALYWSLGRVLGPTQAFAARTIVFFDTVGAMQNVQSNALVAGLMIVTFAELDRRRELRAALALTVGTLIKIFPILAAAFALFRPYRLPRFALLSVAAGAVALAAPLLLLGPHELAAQYRSWAAINRLDALDRGYSVMKQLYLWFDYSGANWPVQLAGLAVLLAPLVRYSDWGVERYKLHFVASVLMYAVLFNHKSESPAFVIAVAGVALWFALAERNRFTWSVLGMVAVGTILSSSDVMPRAIQAGFFEPYRFKTVPVCLVWVLVQRELWRRTGSAPRPATRSDPSAPAT